MTGGGGKMNQAVPVDRHEAVHTELHTTELNVVAMLDVEAGLRDILLPTRYDHLADDLVSLIDPEAGLAALVGSVPIDVHSTRRGGGWSAPQGDGSESEPRSVDRVTEVIAEVRSVARQMLEIAKSVRDGPTVHWRRLTDTGLALLSLADRIRLRTISWKEVTIILDEARRILARTPAPRPDKLVHGEQSYSFQARSAKLARRLEALTPAIARLFESHKDPVDMIR
jgi:hypothetical protein